MFRGPQDLIITQWEHSRLSGVLAELLAQSAGISVPRLCGAIALHDWPHFGDGDFLDDVEIGEETLSQRKSLFERLSNPLPLDPFVELIVRMHWLRLSADDDTELRDVLDERRIETLQRQLELSPLAAARLDGWTEVCDMFSFYLSRGETTDGDFELPSPQSEDLGWRLSWTVSPSRLEVRGLPRPHEATVSLLGFETDGYPQVLRPRLWQITCVFQPEAS